VQSGSPWAARGRDWAGVALNYLEPAGSHRNPTWANLDLMAAYRLPIQGRARVSLEARLLNAFNNQTRLQTDAQKYLDLRQIPTPPYFAPYEQLNPFFGSGNAFAPPRRLYVSLAAQF
jgi:outer membrane receptor protein involved in Fe transport